MVDDNTLWAAIDVLDDGLAPPPGCEGDRDRLTEMLCIDSSGPPVLRKKKRAAPPIELSAAMVAFISACLFAGAMSAVFVFHSPLDRLIAH